MLRTLEQQLLSDITESGPMSFEEFVEQALYNADFGFYATRGRAGGRHGDFVTSVEVGPLFAAVIGDWLDDRWRHVGEPSEFRVCEVGAGVGTLFRGINRSQPDCFDALTYTLVERSASMRVAHETLPSERWRSASEVGSGHHDVIVANELLDNLAFGIAERVPDGWAPVDVINNGGFLLRVGQPTEGLAELEKLAPDVDLGTRVPVASHAQHWVKAAREAADYVAIFDYGATTAELATRGPTGWLRTYAGHERGSDPLAQVGQRDITHDVPFDQLPTPSRHCTQAEWLVDHGIDERVAAARAVWEERAHIGDLAAIAARSAVNEAAGLTDPAGLGGFNVLEWLGA